MNILSILLFFIGLGVLVTIHEFGHFSMAKLFNVYVNEFAIGFGPRIFHKKKGETTYSVRAIPLGGFVSMYGEGIEITDGSVPEERSLLGIKKWKRAIIMVAGVTLNVALAFLLFVGYFATTTQIDTRYNRLYIEENSVAYNAGLRTEDNIIQIDYHAFVTVGDKQEEVPVHSYENIKNGSDLYKAFMHLYTDDSIKKTELYPNSKDDYVDLTFHTDNNKQIEIRLEVEEESGQFSYDYVAKGIKFLGRKLGFFQVIGSAFKETGESSILIYRTLGQLFNKEVFENLGGPIAIFKASTAAYKQGFGYYLHLWGVISINLAVINLLPFPGLDGWHLLVVAVEGITKKEIPEKVKSIVSTIGLLLLFGLMAIITVKDVLGLF